MRAPALHRRPADLPACGSGVHRSGSGRTHRPGEQGRSKVARRARRPSGASRHHARGCRACVPARQARRDDAGRTGPDQGPRLRRRRARRLRSARRGPRRVWHVRQGQLCRVRAISSRVVENLVSTSRALRPSQVGPDAALARRARLVTTPARPPTCARSRRSATSRASSGAPVLRGADGDPCRTPHAWRGARQRLSGGDLGPGQHAPAHGRVRARARFVYEQLRTNTDAYRIFPNKPTAAAPWANAGHRLRPIHGLAPRLGDARTRRSATTSTPTSIATTTTPPDAERPAGLGDAGRSSSRLERRHRADRRRPTRWSR